jgi:hypothetical protein
MRTLLYVPIIHTNADLGSLSKEVAEHGIASLGEEVWERHQQIVAGFWRSVRDAFDGIDVTRMKIYQDGMVADGDIGRRIAEDTAGAGSLNYQLVLELLDRGASLVKTEDFGLVKREYDRLIAMTQARSIGSKLMAVVRYKIAKGTLLKKRDAFIARRINETLESEETGILFIGALHDVVQWLAADIRIEEVKDRRRVWEYQRLLLFHSKHAQQFEEVSRHLIAPVAHRLL